MKRIPGIENHPTVFRNCKTLPQMPMFVQLSLVLCLLRKLGAVRPPFPYVPSWPMHTLGAVSGKAKLDPLGGMVVGVDVVVDAVVAVGPQSI